MEESSAVRRGSSRPDGHCLDSAGDQRPPRLVYDRPDQMGVRRDSSGYDRGRSVMDRTASKITLEAETK